MVTGDYGCDEADLMRRHSRNNEARQVMLYLAVSCSRGRYRLAELAERCGITTGALTRAREIMLQRMAADKPLTQRVRALVDTVQKLDNCK